MPLFLELKRYWERAATEPPTRAGAARGSVATLGFQFGEESPSAFGTIAGKSRQGPGESEYNSLHTGVLLP